MALQVGSRMPEFALPGVANGDVRRFSLEEHRGRWVIPFFYAHDFTSVCGSEVQAFQRRFDDFAQIGVDLLGISVDSLDSHENWISQLGGLSFPLLSDENGQLAQSWGVLAPQGGKALRSAFIVDPDGILQFQMVHATEIAPSINEIYRFALALQTGELCPADWKPGEETLGKAA